MVLRLLEPGKEGERLREYLIHGDEFLLGRGNDCDLCLYDTTASRHHCLIRVRGSEITLADLGSSNGTFLNGTRVISQTALQTGDEIRVGACRYVVDLGNDADFAEQFLRSDVDPKALTSRLPPQELAKRAKTGEES